MRLYLEVVLVKVFRRVDRLEGKVGIQDTVVWKINSDRRKTTTNTDKHQSPKERRRVVVMMVGIA